MSPKVTIAIPCYNNEKHITAAIESSLAQKYPNKEILIIDDCSTDDSVLLISRLLTSKDRLVVNPENLGIGKNLEKLMKEAKGRYIVYLCADDIFADINVISDVVHQFDKGDPAIGVLGRYYYYFMDGHEGAIGVCRERNILIQSCCPSGMAFRRMDIKSTNKIFIEMPSIVVEYLKKYRWSMLEYDTIGARYHPGGNTGTKSSYYTQSPTQNWIDLLGENYQDFPMFVQLKNRAPHLLWGEICLHVRNNKKVLLSPRFWFYTLTALLVPRFALKKLSNFYRHRISRLSAKIIERSEEMQTKV